MTNMTELLARTSISQILVYKVLRKNKKTHVIILLPDDNYSDLRVL